MPTKGALAFAQFCLSDSAHPKACLSQRAENVQLKYQPPGIKALYGR